MARSYIMQQVRLVQLNAVSNQMCFILSWMKSGYAHSMACKTDKNHICFPVMWAIWSVWWLLPLEVCCQEACLLHAGNQQHAHSVVDPTQSQLAFQVPLHISRSKLVTCPMAHFRPTLSLPASRTALTRVSRAREVFPLPTST